MNIAIQIVSYYPVVAGAEVFAQRVAEYMVEQGNSVDVITLREFPDLKKYENVNGVDIYRVKPILLPKLKLLSAIPIMARKTIKLDREKDYDLIHSQLVFSAGQAGTIVKKMRAKPCLLTTQGGDLIDYSSEDIMRFSSILKPMVRWSLKNADITHAVSKYCKDMAEEMGAKRTVLIPNGVDVSRFKPREDEKESLREKYGFSSDEKIIISTSRLTPKNGMHILIKAVSKLKNIDGGKLKLLIVGEGSQKDELIKLTSDLGLNDVVQFLGYVTHDQIPEYLSLSDIFCRPSLDEGFGISFIEAMACKVPVIGTPVGGIVDIIEDGQNGLFVEPDNPDDLADKLNVLLSDLSYGQELTKEGYETVQKKFKWEVVLGQMEALYKEVSKGAN